MEGASRRSLGPQAQHTHYMEKPYMVYPTHTQQLHHIQQQNNKHTQTYCELFHQYNNSVYYNFVSINSDMSLAHE